MTEIEQSIRCCPRTCDGPDVVIPGVSGAAGAAGGVGLTGLDGRVPIIRTTEPFIVPLYGDTVTVAVDDTDFLPIFPRTIRFEIAIGGVTFYLLSFTKTTITITPTTADNALLEICKGKPASTPVPVAPRAYRVAWGVPGESVLLGPYSSIAAQGNPFYVVNSFVLLDTFSSQFRTSIHKTGGYHFSLYYDATLEQATTTVAKAISTIWVYSGFSVGDSSIPTFTTAGGYIISWEKLIERSEGYLDGRLVDIAATQTSTARVTYRAENLEPTPQTINANSYITCESTISNNSVTSTSPTASFSFAATAFDGTIDYGGFTLNYGSGFTYTAAGQTTNTVVLTPSDPLWTILTGSDWVAVNFSFSGEDTTSCNPGPTNLSKNVTYESGASVLVKYRYHPFSGYFWFMYDVQSHFSPHSFKLASTGEDLPMASEDDLIAAAGGSDYNLTTVNGFGCAISAEFSTDTTYRIFRSKYPFYGGDGPGAVIVT